MSQRQNFSRDGFRPLEGGADNMASRDVTIDIPLTTVTSRGQTGARKPTISPGGYRPSTELPRSSSPINEKTGLFHRKKGVAGRRKKIEDKGRNAADPEDGTVTSMGQMYDRIMGFSFIVRYILYILPIGFMIAVPIVVGATLAPHARIGGVRIVWFFVWVEVVWLSLWVSKLVAHVLPTIFMFLIGIVSPGVRKYALVLRSLEIPLSLVGWAVTSLATFVPIMTLNPDAKATGQTGIRTWESTVQKILFALLFSTLVLLVEKLIIQLISISYHQTQFSIKIKDSKHNIYLLGLLYDASRAIFPEYSPEFLAEDYMINDSLNLSLLGGSKVQSSGHPSGTATPMRVLQTVGRVGDKVVSRFGNMAREITGKHVFDPNSAHGIVVEALEKVSSSEALARRIWMSLVAEGKEALYVDDIIDVLGRDRKDEAEEAFAALDRDGNGDISIDEMVLTVCDFGRERKSIANSMHDVDQAVNVLDNLLCAVVFLLVIFIFIAFLNRSFTTTLATAGTSLLSLSFVFAVTAQEVLGSCIFLFVKHPFDVGDRVDIAGDQLIVENIRLLFTVFRRVKDHRTTQVANIVLNTVWIDNITRSKAMREQFSLNINVDTSLEDIQLLKNELQNFVRDKDNSRDFGPEVNISVTSVADLGKLELLIDLMHKSNWSNEAVRASRRSKFMCALVLALRRVPIYAPGGGSAAAGDPANPTYSVAISDQQAAANKKEFADNKDKKRMVPASSSDASAASKAGASDATAVSTGVDYFGRTVEKTPGGSEAQIIGSLNARPAAVDPARDNPVAYYRDETAVSSAVRSGSELGRTISTDSDPLLAARRSNDIEEVRGMLRRESTRGRRQASNSQYPSSRIGPQSTVPTISELATNRPARSASRSSVNDGSYSAWPRPYQPGNALSSNPTIPAVPSIPSARQPADYHEYDYTPPPRSGPSSRPESPSSRRPVGGPGTSIRNVSGNGAAAKGSGSVPDATR